MGQPLPQPASYLLLESHSTLTCLPRNLAALTRISELDSIAKITPTIERANRAKDMREPPICSVWRISPVSHSLFFQLA
jgi:hypothetical protein